MTAIDPGELFEETLAIEREDGATIPALRITPAFETAERMRGAGVVIVAGEFGLADEHERFARPLARMGFFTVSIDLVRGMRGDAAAAHARAQALDHAVAIGDVEAALLCVKELARGKLGVIAFDVAAQITLEAAAVLPHIDALVVAGGPPPGDVPLQRVRASILVHETPGSELRRMALVERMQRSRAVLLGFDYDASESFFVRPQGEDEEFDAGVAWDRTRDFLVQTLT